MSCVTYPRARRAALALARGRSVLATSTVMAPTTGGLFLVSGSLGVLLATHSPAGQVTCLSSLDQLATTLTEIGWRHADGRPAGGSAFYRLPAFDVLINVSDHPASWDERRRISPAAATLARAALRRVRGA
jgi:hypothetical protein